MKSEKQFIRDIGRITKAINNPQYVKDAGNIVLAAAKLGSPALSGRLRQSIQLSISEDLSGVTAHIGTNEEYAKYVEFGTGPKGQASHKGVSPEVTPTYRTSPWWVHESQLDPDAIQRYHWFSINTKEGKFYMMTGQAAQPFLYPALKDHEEEIASALEGAWQNAIKGATK